MVARAAKRAQASKTTRENREELAALTTKIISLTPTLQETGISGTQLELEVTAPVSDPSPGSTPSEQSVAPTGSIRKGK